MKDIAHKLRNIASRTALDGVAEELCVLATQIERQACPATAQQPAPRATGRRPTWELVVEDMKARDQLGRDRYGAPLQPGNGRNSLVDAYQEVLDLAVYLRNAIEDAQDMADTLNYVTDKLAKSRSKEAGLEVAA